MAGIAIPGVQRCSWAGSDPELVAYHDHEWGVPQHADRGLFELLTLEGAQAGLSWSTILKKRDHYRRAYEQFDAWRVSHFDTRKVEQLLVDPGLVRNRQKIESAVRNARLILALQKEFGSFDAYLWRFVGGKPIQNAWKLPAQVPARSKESEALARDLAKRGFQFVGGTICYAFMQAVGMVNDHLVSCFRYDAIRRLGTPRP